MLCYVGVPKSKHNPGSIPRPRTFLSGGFYADPDPKFASFSPFFGWHKRASVTAATTPKGKKLNLRKEEGKRSPISLSLSPSLREPAAPTTRSNRSNARVDAIGVGSLFLSFSLSLSLSLLKRLFLAFRIMRLRDDPLTIAIKTKASNSRP